MGKITYEQASKRLIEIIEKIEQGQISMDESMSLIEEGKELIKTCYSLLDNAKGKLTEIKETLEGFEEV